jgi:carbon storage regulator
MLVLSRRLGEAIVVADNIVVQVVEIRKGRVRLGIEAPRDVIVERSELRSNRAAAAGRRKARLEAVSGSV